MWFAQVENQFTFAGLPSSDYVARHLDQYYAAEVRDILVNPPPTEKHEKLKAEAALALRRNKKHGNCSNTKTLETANLRNFYVTYEA